MTDSQPMTMKELRKRVREQGLKMDRNPYIDLVTVFRKNGDIVEQGPRYAIEERLRSGEALDP